MLLIGISNSINIIALVLVLRDRTPSISISVGRQDS